MPTESFTSPDHVSRHQAESRRDDRGVGDHHAADRRDRDHHGAAPDGDFAQFRPGGAERGGHRLSAERGRLHPGQRLGRGSVRRAHSLSGRDRAVHLGFRPVRPQQQRGRADGCTGAAGLRRRHDGAGRAARPVPQRRAIATGAHHGLSAGAGAARPGARAPDRRLHHHLFLLALDLLGECAARDPRHRAGDALLRQSEGRQAAPAGLDRLPAHRPLALLHPV